MIAIDSGTFPALQWDIPQKDMKIAPRTVGFTLIELIVVIVVIFVLATLVVPAPRHQLVTAQMAQALSNCRHIQLLTEQMTIDGLKAGEDGMEWTSIRQRGSYTQASLSAYFEALVKGNYLTNQELKKLLTGPGKHPGDDPPNAQNICFKFFQVDEASPPDQPFVVSANWEQGQLSNSAPFGKKGFVIFNKGGGGNVYREQAKAGSASIFPSGGRYHHNVLK